MSVDGSAILEDVNLSIGKGETHVLMGPNGVGKSTLGNALVGNPAYEITSGNIYFNGLGIREYQKFEDGALLIITHTTKILESLHVDRTHVLVKGRIVESGDGSLVDEINENGFGKYMEQPESLG